MKGTKEDHLKYMKQGKKSWLSKIYHTKSLIVDKFGVEDVERYHFLKHSPTILDRDVMYELWDEFPEAIKKVTHHRTRKPDGLSMTWLHHHYCLFHPDHSCFVLPQACVRVPLATHDGGGRGEQTLDMGLHGGCRRAVGWCGVFYRPG